MSSKKERERGEEMGALFVRLIKAAEASLKANIGGVRGEYNSYDVNKELQHTINAAYEWLGINQKE